MLLDELNDETIFFVTPWHFFRFWIIIIVFVVVVTFVVIVAFIVDLFLEFNFFGLFGICYASLLDLLFLFEIIGETIIW